MVMRQCLRVVTRLLEINVENTASAKFEEYLLTIRVPLAQRGSFGFYGAEFGKGDVCGSWPTMRSEGTVLEFRARAPTPDFSSRIYGRRDGVHSTADLQTQKSTQ